METNRNDKERNEGSSWQNESQHMGSQNKSYGYNEEGSNEDQQNMSGHDESTGSSMQSQGMGSRGNEMNDPTSSNNPQGWDSESNRMSGRNDGDDDETWDTTGGDTYNAMQNKPGRNLEDQSGEESMRMSDSGSGNEWDSTRQSMSSDDIDDEFNSGSGSQSMSGSNNDMNDDWDGRSSSQSMSGRNNETDDWSRNEGHNMSSGSAYLEEETDRASQGLSGGHDYMENNGNSSSDYELNRRLGSDQDFDGGSHSQEMRSDNDDFNDSGLDEERSFTDRRSSDSRTFNEDEDTWRHEQNMSGYEDDANNETRQAGNRGTSNNNWDANDQTQRGREWHGDEDEKNSLF
jgi:hypothetical protein